MRSLRGNLAFFVVTGLFVLSVFNGLAASVAQGEVYLPLILKGLEQAPPPDGTPTVKPPIPTEEPTATSTGEPGDTGNIVITNIFYNGVKGSAEPDEYVEFRNDDTKVIQLAGWKLSDFGEIHVFTFPSFEIQPGQVCRVYTNESHPESCGFTFGNDAGIWNNTGDTATLRDANGNFIDDYSY
jgi:hypothetical protein